MTEHQHQTIVDLYPDLFAGVDAADVRRISTVVGSGILDGDEPTREDIEVLLRINAGEITHDQAVADAIAQAQAEDAALSATRAAG